MPVSAGANPLPTTGQTFYPTLGTQDQTFTGGNVIDGLTDQSFTAAAIPTTTVTFTTVAAGQIKTVIPNTDNQVAGDTTQNNGFAFGNSPTTPTPQSYLYSVTNAQRIIPAGVWTFNGTVNLNIPALLGTVSATITAKVYRVATGGGTRTLLFSVTTAALTNASATAANDSTYSVQSASQPLITLAAGEVIEVGYYVTSQATQNTLNQITNTVVKIYLGNRNGTDTAVIVPAPGVRTLYTRVPTETLPLSEGPTRLVVFPRALSESLTISESPTRASGVTRSFTETTTTIETLTKVASFPRSMTEVTAVSETSTRIASFNKSLTETLVATETVTHTAGLYVRTFTDTLTTSETLTKVITYGRVTHEYPPGLTPDYPVVFAPFKAIAGYIRLRSNPDPNNVFTMGATVKLIRDNDNFLCQTTVSAADGSYYFARDKFDPYTYTVAANVVINGTPQQDITRKGLSPV